MRKDILDHLRHHLDLAKKIFPSAYACVAGGALRDLDHDKPIKDIDIFLCCKYSPHYRSRHKYAKDPKTAPYSYLADIQKIYGRAVKSIGTKYGNVWKHNIELLNVVNIEHKPFPLQYIFYTNMEGRPGPSSLLSSFDINFCKILFDGKKIIRTPEYKEDRDNQTLTHTARSINTELEKRLARLRDKYPDHTIQGSTQPARVRQPEPTWDDTRLQEILHDLRLEAAEQDSW
jgi:hypothetical protein